MTVLVTYASRHGATKGIAAAIAERLRERGRAAELRPVDEVYRLDGAEAVVLGSAVYAGSWMKGATAFVQRHREALSSLPVWLFSSGPTGSASDQDWTPKQIAAVSRDIGPRDHRVFFGAIDAEKLGFVERRIVKAVKAPTGDFRDWDRVRAYADEIADALEGES